MQVQDKTGAGINNLGITAVPWMPDHGHGTSVKPMTMSSGQNGQYTITPLYLFMAGLWQITLQMQNQNVTPATTDQVVFSFCLNDN